MNKEQVKETAIYKSVKEIKTIYNKLFTLAQRFSNVKGIKEIKGIVIHLVLFLYFLFHAIISPIHVGIWLWKKHISKTIGCERCDEVDEVMYK